MKYDNTLSIVIKYESIEKIKKIVEPVIGVAFYYKHDVKGYFWGKDNAEFRIKPNWYEDEDGAGPVYPHYADYAVIFSFIDIPNPDSMKRALLQAFANHGMETVIEFERLVSPIPDEAPLGDYKSDGSA